MTDQELTDERIAHDLALAEAASPGPWTGREYGGRPEDGPTSYQVRDAYGFDICELNYDELGAYDIDFLIAARTGYPAALREVQQWRREATPEKHHAECDTCLNREVEVRRLREALETLIQFIESGVVCDGVGRGSYRLPKWNTQEVLFYAARALEGIEGD